MYNQLMYFISAKFENNVHTLRLPPVDDLVGLETFLELLCEDLGYCEGFVSTSATQTCDKCVSNGEQSVKQDGIRVFKRKGN